MIPSLNCNLTVEIQGRAILKENLLILDILLNQGKKYAGKA